ncbi:MAG: enoyl-CoA hydratase/isomerase family protein [Rhizobiaceae bacterium]|nr:enoyl-CoA hydratase/isomerase family protein [Rhizobiaceae bacterium]
MSFVTAEKIGLAGVIGLDRPKALNALDLSMIRDLTRALDKFESDAEIKRIILRSNHSRAFCAGGDLRRICALTSAGFYDEAELFFQTEYALNLRIATFSKPYISLIDGMCMGGGLGLTVHGHYRIASENAVFAMPETGIGFVPDVGGSYFLPRMPYRAGYWMGLTGARVRNFDAHALGLSTHMSRAVMFDKIFEALCSAKSAPNQVLEEFCGVLGYQTSVLNLVSAIQCFEKPTLCSIRDYLANTKSPEAQHAKDALKSASPRSLQETMTLLRRGANSTLEACLAREFKTVQRAIRHPDLNEGVRAILIDKDHAPHWPSAKVSNSAQKLSICNNNIQPQAAL